MIDEFLKKHNISFQRLNTDYVRSYYGEVTTYRRKSDVTDDIPEIVNIYDDGSVEVIHNNKSEMYANGQVW